MQLMVTSQLNQQESGTVKPQQFMSNSAALIKKQYCGIINCGDTNNCAVDNGNVGVYPSNYP